MSNAASLTAEQIHAIVDGLSTLEPGVLPPEIFQAVTRLVATPIVEVVPLRRGKQGKPEVLLLRREADDPVWPNQLHVPGTVVRSSDTAGNFGDAMGRISNELGGVTLKSPTFVQNIIHHSGRGMEVSQIYWVEISGDEPLRGEFFMADDVPEGIVRSQLDFIPVAVAHYMDSRAVA